MSPELTEARSRRFRPKLWISLLIPILAAFPILAWSGIHPFAKDPAALAIKSERDWAEIGTGHYVKSWPKPGGKWPDFLSESGTANCLIEITYVEPGNPESWPGGPQMGIPYFFRHAWITQNAVNFGEYRYSHAIQGSGGEIDHPSLARARGLVAALPPSRWWVEPRSALLVGSLQNATWEVRTYDRASLPGEVLELIELAGMRYPE